jgi:hypothetical protein
MSYAPVSNETVDPEALKGRWQALSNGPKQLKTYTRCLIIISIPLAIVLIWVLIRDAIKVDHPLTSCGHSTAEALSLGCSFDVMSFAWLPTRCFDEELTNGFLALRNWQWYLDADGVKSVDFSSVAGAAYDELYVTQEYHMYHCTYMWRKMHRASLAGKVLDGYIADLHHTAHCELEILNAVGERRGLNDTSMTIYSKYVDCPLENKDLGRLGWYRMIGGRRVHRDP